MTPAQNIPRQPCFGLQAFGKVYAAISFVNIPMVVTAAGQNQSVGIGILPGFLTPVVMVEGMTVDFHSVKKCVIGGSAFVAEGMGVDQKPALAVGEVRQLFLRKTPTKGGFRCEKDCRA